MPRPTSQPQAFTAHCQSLEIDVINDALTPAEKSFIAVIGSFSANGLTAAVDAAAKRFLEAAPTPQATRRRAHALLRFAVQTGNDRANCHQRNEYAYEFHAVRRIRGEGSRHPASMRNVLIAAPK
jgi:hypothetical protein